MRKVKAHRGMTLIELCIAMALTSLVMLLAVNFLSLAVTLFNRTNKALDASRNETFTASRLSQAVQESSLVFTVPQDSFNDTKNLTAGWEYLGLMDNVKIPANKSKTGSEIETATALVHITYKGDGTKEPAGYNASDPCWIKNGDGYFYMDILGHDYEDSQGLVHKYTLEFEPVDTSDPSKTMEKSIRYTLKSKICNKDGAEVGDDNDNKELNVDTVLHAKNALQVVYTGTNNNPATALAFQTKTVAADATMTLVLILDMSGSMRLHMKSEDSNTETRIKCLKETLIGDADSGTTGIVQSFINEKYDRVNVILVPFAHFGADYRNYMEHGYVKSNGKIDYDQYKTPTGAVPEAAVQDKAYARASTKYYVASEAEGNKELIADIQALDPWGWTNVGDGLRIAYYRMNELAEKGQLGQPFVVVLTDGAVSSCTLAKEYNWYGKNSTAYGTPASIYYQTTTKADGTTVTERVPWKTILTYDDNAAGMNPSIPSGGARLNWDIRKMFAEDDKLGVQPGYNSAGVYTTCTNYAVGQALRTIVNDEERQDQHTYYYNYIKMWVEKINKLEESCGNRQVHNFLIPIKAPEESGDYSEDVKELRDILQAKLMEAGSSEELQENFEKIQATVDTVMDAFRGPKM